MNLVEKYIEENWDKCIVHKTEDDGTLVGLPYPYTVPAVGHFDEIYYWDTYFTNLGLLAGGHFEYAKNNTDDLLFLVDKFGFMPNGNRTYYLNRSQPPFLSEMVKDVYYAGADDNWLKSAYATLKKEYSFWMNKRSCEVGLNVYGGTPENYDGVADFIRRTGYDPNEAPDLLALHNMITCESGWDINPRWGTTGYNFAPVDLNALMYMFEENMQKFSEILQLPEEMAIWEERKTKRKDAMVKLMKNADDILLDYNFKSGEKSEIFSVASFYPMFAGLLSAQQAKTLVDNLGRVEERFGIVTCEKNNAPGRYQWDYPNGWSCLQYIVVSGLIKYGYQADAKRIMEKYISLVDKIFAETGNLWEKYNVVEGNINVSNEYEMPPMMGWSAGVYSAFKSILNNMQGGELKK